MNLKRFIPSWIAAAANAGGDRFTFTAPIEITAEAAEGKQGGGRPTFHINAYDGTALNLESFYSPVIVDLAGVKTRPNATVKVLRDHDRGRVVGHATTVQIDSTGIAIAGVMSGKQTEVDDIVSSHKAKFPWEASIGAQVTRREFLEAGKTAIVNGKTFTGPAIIARESLMYEVSFVAIGAAEQTSAAISANSITPSSEGNVMTFEQWLTAKGFDINTITAAQNTTLSAMWRAEVAAAAATPTGTAPAGGSTPAPAAQQPSSTGPATQVAASAAAGTNTAPANGQTNGQTNTTVNAAAPQQQQQPEVVGSIRAEYARMAEIDRICAAHGNPRIDVNGTPVELKAHAIAQGWDADKTELNAIRASRPQAPGLPFANTGGGGVSVAPGAPAHARVIECAMCLAAGMTEEFVKAQFKENEINAAMDRRVRGFGIQQLIHASLAGSGQYHGFGRMDNSTIEAALQNDPALNGGPRMGIQASGFSTISLSGILGNVANKKLLERFSLFTSMVPEICWETDTRDFKAFSQYRLDGSGSFGKVGADGELKHIGLKQSAYANQLDTHGGIIALTRQMIYNDDLSAFLQIPSIFAELALHAREQMVAETLIGNAGSFFQSADATLPVNMHTTALGIAGLSAAVKLFRELKNAGGKFTMLNPDRVLVAPYNEAVADQLFASQNLVGTTTADALMPENNPHKGKYRPIVSPYLSEAQGISGADNDDWYLACNPQTGMAMVSVGYLQGARTPTIESAQANFNVLGVQWRSFWDFGVAQHEQRAGVKGNVG